MGPKSLTVELVEGRGAEGGRGTGAAEEFGPGFEEGSGDASLLDDTPSERDASIFCGR